MTILASLRRPLARRRVSTLLIFSAKSLSDVFALLIFASQRFLSRHGRMAKHVCTISSNFISFPPIENITRSVCGPAKFACAFIVLVQEYETFCRIPILWLLPICMECMLRAPDISSENLVLHCRCSLCRMVALGVLSGNVANDNSLLNCLSSSILLVTAPPQALLLNVNEMPRSTSEFR